MRSSLGFLRDLTGSKSGGTSDSEQRRQLENTSIVLKEDHQQVMADLNVLIV